MVNESKQRRYLTEVVARACVVMTYIGCCQSWVDTNLKTPTEHIHMQQFKQDAFHLQCIL